MQNSYWNNLQNRSMSFNNIDRQLTSVTPMKRQAVAEPPYMGDIDNYNFKKQCVEPAGLNPLSPNGTRSRARIQPFIQKLYNMLGNSSVHNIVCWCEGNTGALDDTSPVFVVKNPQLFSQNVLPQYFDCTLQSFKRQLNYYGFIRIENNDEDNGKAKKKKSRALKYRHERNKFQRNREDLLHEVQRSTCNDPKIQMDYLREKVLSLENENCALMKEMTRIKEEMTMFRKFMEESKSQNYGTNEGIVNRASIGGTISSVPLQRTKNVVHTEKNAGSLSRAATITTTEKTTHTSVTRMTSIQSGLDVLDSQIDDFDFDSSQSQQLRLFAQNYRTTSAILSDDEGEKETSVIEEEDI